MKDKIFSSEKDLFEFMAREAEESLLAEICAMVGTNKAGDLIYRQMQNRSKDPNMYFMIDPYDYLRFIKEYRVFGVFHSHLAGNEEPSDFDIKTSENCCLVFLIYSTITEKFSIYEPRLRDYDVNTVQRLKEAL